MRAFIVLVGAIIFAFNAISGTLILSQPSTSNKFNKSVLSQSSDPDIVFASNRDGQFEIYRIDPSGRNLVRLTTGFGENRNPVWSPDGERIAFTSDRDGNNEIYIMNADGSQQTNITNNSVDDHDPIWSPDGTRIVFSSEGEIFVTMADGTGLMNISQAPSFDDGAAIWAPDGQQLAFISSREGYYPGIYLVHSDGSNQRKLDTFVGTSINPSWSPDSKQIVFEGVEDNTSQWDIYKVNADGSNLTNLTNDSASDSSPVWSPDGAYIAFESQFGEDGDGVYIMAPDGTSIELLYETPPGLKLIGSWAWSPDSQKLVFSVGYDISNPFGQIVLINLQQHTTSYLTPRNSPVLDFQPSWQTITNTKLIPTATVFSEAPTERAPETTLQPTPQTQSLQNLPRANYNFYLFGYIFTGLGAIITIFLLIWLARSRGYPISFFSTGISVILIVLVLVVLGILLRNKIYPGSIREPNGLPTPTLMVIPSPTLDIMETAIVDAETVSPTPEPLKQQAEISCQNEIYFVSLRSTPGTDPANKILEIPCGEFVELLGPSQEVNGLTWWNISWNDYTGWVADHTRSGKVILIFNP